MSAPVTARELEAARALLAWIGENTFLSTHEGRAIYLHADDCPSYCDHACNGAKGESDAAAFDGLLDRLMADADAAGYERGRAEQREALRWAHSHGGCDCGEAGEHPEQCPVAVALGLPHSDEDGRCVVCGLEYEDPAVLTHECPPGFRASAGPDGRET